MSEGSHDGRGGGLPWASVLDPVANARALEQIQRRGVQAAGELVDRLVAAVDGARERDGTSNGDDAPSPSGPWDGADLLGVWADLVTRTLQAMVRLSVPDEEQREPPTGGPVWVDAVSGRGSGAVALVVDPSAGTSASVELWLHNASERAVGRLRLHVGELRSPDGRMLPDGVVTFEPVSVDELLARSSRGVSVSIVSPEPLAAGRYRGLLQADGADEVTVPVEVTVVGPHER